MSNFWSCGSITAINKCSLSIFQGEKSILLEQRKALSAENKEFRSAIDDKIKEMVPLHEALGQLRGPRNAGRERGPVVCSSEEELNSLVSTRL